MFLPKNTQMQLYTIFTRTILKSTISQHAMMLQILKKMTVLSEEKQRNAVSISATTVPDNLTIKAICCCYCLIFSWLYIKIRLISLLKFFVCVYHLICIFPFHLRKIYTVVVWLRLQFLSIFVL